MKSIALILSCEHAVDTVPQVYQRYFTSPDYQSLLESHRGIDFGALAIANYLQAFFKCEMVVASITRLLIDCNRSLSYASCFSEITGSWSEQDKDHLIQHYYLPFRMNVEKIVRKNIEQGHQIWHLSIHSFTPVLNHQQRNTDIGLLYDPKRTNEKAVVLEWQQRLQSHPSLFRVRRNYPYRGISDGFTTALRKQFADKDYLGIEVESNQGVIADEKNRFELAAMLAETLRSLIDSKQLEMARQM